LKVGATERFFMKIGDIHGALPPTLEISLEKQTFSAGLLRISVTAIAGPNIVFPLEDEREGKLIVFQDVKHR
jgi:hypothetical protein